MIGVTVTAMSRRWNCGLTAVAIDNSGTNLATAGSSSTPGLQQHWRNGPDLGVPPFRDQGSQRPWSRDRPGSRRSRQGCRGRALDTRDEGAGSQYRRRPQDRSRRRPRGSALRVAPQRITRGASQRSDDNSAAVVRASTPGGAPLGLSADKAAAAWRQIKPTTATKACPPAISPRSSSPICVASTRKSKPTRGRCVMRSPRRLPPCLRSMESA